MAKRAAGGSSSKDVAAIKHMDKRANIPTEELRDFVLNDETNPEVLTWPRDTALDPQLVWRGKDALDTSDLSVPVVPIYIQEKIHPQVLMDALLKPDEEEFQPTLFSDFNGGPKEFEQKIDFYHHEQNWTNRLILGDSLLIMASLAEKERLKGKIQTIYIDPPYGIKFGSNWQVSTRKTEVRDSKAEDATRQPEQIRAFRDTWSNGIHSYLTYLRDRMTVARDLLTESGSIFIQISDENTHLVRILLDEVFGSDNFMSQISYATTAGFSQAKGLGRRGDYILWYAKDETKVKVRNLWQESGDRSGYNMVELADGSRRRMSKSEQDGSIALPPKSRVFRLSPTSSQGLPSSPQPFEFDGKTYHPTPNSHWKANYPLGMQRLAWANRLFAQGSNLSYVRYEEDFPYRPLSNVWLDTGIAGYASDKRYVVQTSTKVVERCILMTTDPGDLVFDPTCGSGTTAVVAEQWGRRWITCDTSRVSLAIARTRLMSAKFPAYLLTDSQEGKQKEEEILGTRSTFSEFKGDIRKGFVYKRVSHLTLGAIANCEALTPNLNPEPVQGILARHADSELLVDAPYEDSKRIRVCGPFSVESLSPHRVLSVSDSDQDGTVSEIEAREQQDFAAMILENLRKSGIQNTRKEERITFVSLEPFAGRWINAVGLYKDPAGNEKRVAVSIGPELGTVGPDQIKEAAKEAVQGVGFDILAVCGFAFDPHVSEEVKRYGNLTVLPTKMNPDLAMGDELLKKTGAGNLFMVFGEPDIKVSKNGSKVSIELLGLDVYDPTIGAIRSNSTDDIACWFIDTDYNGESFFVRHAYFTGADNPMDKLKQALKAQIDEEAWSYIYSTKSREFEMPKSKKIAVKVINHYGDEVLSVLDLG